MILVLQSMRRIHNIGKKMMILIIGFSSAITLVISSVQLFLDYRQQRSDVDLLLERVAVFLPPIADSVWTFSDHQVTLALNSLVSLPGIHRAAITLNTGETPWVVVGKPVNRVVTRTYTLDHLRDGKVQSIASIELDAGLDQLYDRMLLRALGLLVSNGIKTFLVAGFMYALFRHLVTNRIEELARNVHGLAPQLAPQAMSFFNDQDSQPVRGDEIDAVRWAFDSLSQRLKLVITDLNARNVQLQAENQERHRAEQELQKVVDQLSKAVVELERFAYVAAHDLQEPIRSIVSFSQMLERHCAEGIGDSGREYLAFIISESRRLSRLVNDLLEYSRNNHQNMSVAAIDCGEVVGAIRTSLCALIEQKQAEIAVAPLPVVEGDGVQIQQLFHNLIGNALKYSRPGVAPRISISAEANGPLWRFTIADNGIGIEEQYLHYIFEVFRRLHTRDAYPGTGIGLALCKRVVENHGGTIWAESTPGTGSRFIFTLPAVTPRGLITSQNKE